MPTNLPQVTKTIGFQAPSTPSSNLANADREAHLRSLASSMVWTGPEALQLTKLARAATAVLLDPSASPAAKKMAATARGQIEPHAANHLGDEAFKAAYLAMAQAGNKVLENALLAMHPAQAAARARSTTTTIPAAASGATPTPPPARAAGPAARTAGPRATGAAERQAERLARREALAADQAAARAARAEQRVARQAGAGARSTQGQGSAQAARPGAGDDAAAVTADPAPGRAATLAQNLRTKLAVARATHEGRSTTAALPDIERKLGKRAAEVARMQSSLSPTAAARARDRAAEAELAGLAADVNKQ